jgi:hypothetical protein
MGGTMKITALAFLFLTINSIGFAQIPPKTAPAKENAPIQIAELPTVRRIFRPKLSLQDALKLAEKYISDHKEPKINVSKYYLNSAGFILYGGKNYTTGKDLKEPAWSFSWVHEDGALGNYLSIIVLIESKAVIHLPSM